MKDLTQQSQTLVQHVDPHMWESEGDQPSMQQLVALHRPKKHNFNGVFQRTSHRIFGYVKCKVVNTQICVCSPATKCECRSIIHVLWTSEFIASPLSPIQCD